MHRYDIVIDGELTADLADPTLEVQRRNSDGATILSVPAEEPGSLARALDRLEALGIGVTGIRKVDDEDSPRPVDER